MWIVLIFFSIYFVVLLNLKYGRKINQGKVFVTVKSDNQHETKVEIEKKELNSCFVKAMTSIIFIKIIIGLCYDFLNSLFHVIFRVLPNLIILGLLILFIHSPEVINEINTENMVILFEWIKSNLSILAEFIIVLTILSMMILFLMNRYKPTYSLRENIKKFVDEQINKNHAL
ncbi:hypothetical protein [Xenorhabdus ishibashii]|uniref:Uncharacterized protein n=1 Tax=Xenorhabdus ishibashii TaxID=1034471 RepID=A0A2D0K7X8_9GAMM|nr:hypothetical protein [Xenorhabdus ishibashii]PHM59483.1 hypothetical protein Xish_03601 [Xenorhabdus ishibashii]